MSFLDGDDALFPQALAEQFALLERHRDVAMVYGPIQWWYSWTGNAEDAGRDYVEELGVASDSIVEPPRLVPLFLRDKAAVPSGILIRRSVAQRLGGFESEFMGEYEDQVFCAKVCLQTRVFAAARCWYRYRQHSESAVAVGMRTGATHAARVRFLAWLADYVAAQRIRDPAVFLAIGLERWRFSHPRLFRLVRRGERLMAQVAARSA